MTEANHFPQGVAVGNAFIGREEELKNLSDNIRQGHHTLLMAPRRFGKTSLALNTLNKQSLAYAEINLHLAITAESVEKKLVLGVQEIIKQVVSKPEQLLKIFNDFLNKTKVKFELTLKGLLNIELSIDKRAEDDVPTNVLESLKLAEHVLKKQKKKAVIFLDEVQEIESIKQGYQIEGAIREFAQKSKHLIFIFSGSNRRMLVHMFDDRSMPLYELCERINLGRIDVASYEKYLNKISKKTWGSAINSESFEKIMHLSQRHPRRVYNLCLKLWRDCEDKAKGPAADDVQRAWDDYVKLRLRDVRYNLSHLSGGALKVLTLIALGQNTELTGKESMRKTGLAGSTIIVALKVLEDADYIEQTSKSHFAIVDPLIKTVLAKHERENLNN